MSKVMLSESYLDDIADAIRAKTGTQDTYTPGEMPEAIESISGGGITPTGTINITENGTVDVTQYASADVNVPSVSPTGTINITQNGTTDVTNYASANVSVPNPSTGTKQISITQNGTTTEDVTSYANAEITVNVSGGYDINSGNLFDLFEQYADENNMVKHDLAFASNQTDYVTVAHTLGRVPVEALLYPKNPTLNSGGYQVGWTKNLFGQDKTGNRTYKIHLRYPPADTTDVSYFTGKTLLALLTSIQITDYNFSRNPTSTTVDLRGGTSAETKLLAGEYVLAVK